MSDSNNDQKVAALAARQVGLSLFLLALFAPVVLAVGSAAFRPAWLLSMVGGVPLSVLWVLLSIGGFIALTWLLARSVFARVDEETGQ